MFASTGRSLFLIFLRSFKSSAAVLVPNSQIFSTSRIRFQTSAADSPSSRLSSKKSALLCGTFLSCVKCSRDNVYILHNGSELGSLSLTVLVISVLGFCPIADRNISFISASKFLIDHGIVAVFLCCSSYLIDLDPLSSLHIVRTSAITCLRWCSLIFPKWTTAQTPLQGTEPPTGRLR